MIEPLITFFSKQISPDMEDTTKNAGDLRQARSVAGVTYDVTAEWPARGNLLLTEVEVYGRP